MELQLDERGAILLKDVLSMQLEAMEEAKDRMIEDHSIDDLEVFTDTMAIHQNNIQTLSNIRREITQGLDHDDDRTE